MMVTVIQLQKIMPALNMKWAVIIEKPINITTDKFSIDNVNRQAAFFGQLAVESGQLMILGENLNYSAKRLTEVWPKRFPTLEVAKPYALNPEKLANKTYANRNGNGDEASGDGWRYRGAGFIQITGKTNYTACADYFGLDLKSTGDWLRTADGACLSAGWYWHTRNLNKYADLQDIVTITQRINGGTHGLDRRIAFTNTAKKVLSRV